MALALARERPKAVGLQDQLEFHMTDYRKVEGLFDRIVSAACSNTWAFRISGSFAARWAIC
jgi:cyclopropane fatty-acyl-phospholipid synthase-like methyltransferase